MFVLPSGWFESKPERESLSKSSVRKLRLPKRKNCPRAKMKPVILEVDSIAPFNEKLDATPIWRANSGYFVSAIYL